MEREYRADSQFDNHFRSLRQVFMYITDRCNLECEQCIYKPSINHYINEEIALPDALGLLKKFRSMGATKVTFLGGEPTIYGHRDNGKPLLNLLQGTKDIGYEYIRMDTNGQKMAHLFDKTEFSNLNEIAFSLDGYCPETNDPLRGKGTFVRAVTNVKKALSLGYKVTITCCIQKLFLSRDIEGILKLERMIRFAQDLGVHQINFHDLFKVGIPMDTWTGDFAPKVEDWPPVYQELFQKIKNNEFSISVRLPQCFVTKSEFAAHKEYYGYCPVKMGERVMVHPNGVIRICSNLICTGYGAARYSDGHISWDHTHNNEVAGHDLNNDTPCTNRSRHKKYGDLVPLCFSFKPEQEEHVWQEKLNWDSKLYINAANIA